MKLRRLHIEDFKVFKDFDIDFLDSNDNPLSIVVLAGVNGSGKTTLLEGIVQYFKEKKEEYLYTLQPQKFGLPSKLYRISIETNDNNFDNGSFVNKTLNKIEDEVYYFPAGKDDITKVANEFVKSFYFFLKKEDYRPSEVKEHFHKYMKNIFKDIDLTFTYSHLDRDDNVWFFNNNGEKFEINNLSTGEKTLLSKIMYLYFLDYKNKVILIDEPELSLHPSWQNKVLKIYENFAKLNNCQIIIATHSPHIIGSAKSESLRILKKVDDKIEAFKYSQSYGFEFSKILTDIMDVEYLRTPDVGKQLAKVKSMIILNEFNSEIFQDEWKELESLLGEKNLDLKLLKLEIASRKKNV